MRECRSNHLLYPTIQKIDQAYFWRFMRRMKGHMKPNQQENWWLAVLLVVLGQGTLCCTKSHFSYLWTQHLCHKNQGWFFGQFIFPICVHHTHRELSLTSNYNRTLRLWFSIDFHKLAGIPCMCTLSTLPGTKFGQLAHTSRPAFLFACHFFFFSRGIHYKIVKIERITAKNPCARSHPRPLHTGYGLPAFFPQIGKFHCNSNRMKPHMDSLPVLSIHNLQAMASISP